MVKKQDLVTDKRWMTVAVKDIEEQYNVVISESIDEICNAVDSVCTKYFEWLSIELSDVGRVSSAMIYKKLDELIT